jgi:hypothetical protein
MSHDLPAVGDGFLCLIREMRSICKSQNGEAVRKFLREEYPGIKKAAKKCGATIYWWDESAIRSDYHSGTTWSKKGETPVLKTTGARVSVIGLVQEPI